MVNQNIEIDIDNDYLSKTHLRYYNYNFVHDDAFSYELVTYRSVTEIYKKSPELEKYKAAALLVAFQLKQLIRVYWIIYICLPFPFRLNLCKIFFKRHYYPWKQHIWYLKSKFSMSA